MIYVDINMDEAEISLFNDNHVSIKLSKINNKIYCTEPIGGIMNNISIVKHIRDYKRTISKKKHNERLNFFREQKIKILLNK